MKQRVLVGMSGGIDSAMTARMLQAEGYDVYGVHFNFYTPEEQIDAEKAKINALAKRLDMDIEFYDARNVFQNDVIAYFADYYSRGLTPSPCVHCNANTKLKLLYDLCVERDFDVFATGHYIQIKNKDGWFEVHKGVDPNKDQSYYMWQVPQAVLARFITPLGGQTKDEIKIFAQEQGFIELVKKKESAGLCFAQGRNLTEMLNDYLPGLVDSVGEGIVVDRDGNTVGKHNGYFYYTIGQKSNMELSIDGKPAVVQINAETNTLMVDHYKSLYVDRFVIRDSHFNIQGRIEDLNAIETKVRGLGLNPAGYSKLLPMSNNRFVVELENPAWAPAPGQPAVFYCNHQVLGGGIIC